MSEIVVVNKTSQFEEDMMTLAEAYGLTGPEMMATCLRILAGAHEAMDKTQRHGFRDQLQRFISVLERQP